MSKKRYLACAGILAVCVCVAIGTLALLPPRTSVTKANFDRIKVGMSMAEVEEILGPKADLPLPISSIHDPNTWYLWLADDWSQGRIGFVEGRVSKLGTWHDSDETATQN